MVGGVKLTFFEYPFRVKYVKKFDKVIRLPDLLTLAAMKAYALGRWAKWKDYVDLYFIMRDHHSLKAIAARARAIFGSEFSEKRFRTQLAYFKDIDRSEEIIYLPGFQVSDAQIKKALIDFSL